MSAENPSTPPEQQSPTSEPVHTVSTIPGSTYNETPGASDEVEQPNTAGEEDITVESAEQNGAVIEEEQGPRSPVDDDPPPEPVSSPARSSIGSKKGAVFGSGQRIKEQDESEGSGGIAWKELSFTVETKDGPKVILDKVSGSARPGELVAILGPSGAGKTSLLSILSGQLPKKGELTGGVIIDGNDPRKVATADMAYVHQFDSHMPSATVQESLEFACGLRLDGVTDEYRKKRVDELISELGLEKIRGQPIGDDQLKGISGGEMKRVSLGVALISNPSIVLADEPTTGLDATTALAVVDTLRQLADKGKTVLTTIHQPRYEIFQKFDRVILMANAKVAFEGPAEFAMQYFTDIGHAPPPYSNPAEHLLNLVRIASRANDKEDVSTVGDVELDGSSADLVQSFLDGWPKSSTFANQSKRIGPQEQEAITKYAFTKDSITQAAKANTKTVRGILVQFKWLMKRELRQGYRHPLSGAAVLFQGIFFALMFGALYWQLPLEVVAIQDRASLLVFVSSMSGFLPGFVSLATIPALRPMLVREFKAGSYGVFPAFISIHMGSFPARLLNLIVGTSIVYPMVGLNIDGLIPHLIINFLLLEMASLLCLGISAFFETMNEANIVGNFLLSFLFLFSTYFAPLPAAIRWFGDISQFLYGYQGLMLAEFTGDGQITCDPRPCDFLASSVFVPELGLDVDLSEIPNPFNPTESLADCTQPCFYETFEDVRDSVNSEYTLNEHMLILLIMTVAWGVIGAALMKWKFSKL